MGVSKSKSAKLWHLQGGLEIVEQAPGSLPVPTQPRLVTIYNDHNAVPT